MPRKAREVSDFGMYHVMIRGINKQNIFLDEDDYMTMQRVLADANITRNNSGKIVSYDDCQVMAYALMPNHVHILLKEGSKNISQVMKKIQDRFVYFYNQKYDRCGHLFQDRFRSEAVKDESYLYTLIRYIHLNPVKGMLCDRPEDYEYSSWREYIGLPVIIEVCDKRPILDTYTIEEIKTFVYQFVDDDCMDMDKEKFVLTDKHAWDIIQEISDTENVEDFKQLRADIQLECVLRAIEKGISIRQASRLSILSQYKIAKEIGRKMEMEGLPENFWQLSPMERVLEVIRIDGKISKTGIAELTDVSIYSVKKIIAFLLKEKRIEKVYEKRWLLKVIE